MKLDKLLLFSSALLTFVIACHAFQDKSSATAKDHHAVAKEYSDAENWPKAIEECTLAAETCAGEAIFHLENDAVNTIKAYKRDAAVYGRIAEIALMTNLLTEAIEASNQEAQLYKQAVQLCSGANNIKRKASLLALAATAYERVAGIYKHIAIHGKGQNYFIDKAAARLMAADAFSESANCFRSASDMGNAITMYLLAAGEYAIASLVFKNAENFDKEAKALIKAAEAETLSAWLYRQIDDALNGAEMYTFAADEYMHAAKAYTKADHNDGAIEAYQQAVTWLTIAAQMYHDAGRHGAEAEQYTEIARHYLDRNEHVQAGGAFELAAQASLHAQSYHTAVATFQRAEKAYATANDSIAVQRVQSIVMACEAMTRVLYHEAVRRLALKKPKPSNQIELCVRRSHLMLDSYNQIMALESTKALHAEYAIVFLGEEAVDRGGLSREWFSLLAEEMISPEHDFFVSRNPNDQTYQPNPSKNSPEDLNYYHFFGRILAMTINSGNLVQFRLTDGFLKHMLGQPVVFEDLSSFDPTLYRSYVVLKQMKDLSGMDTFFSINTGNGVVELCPDESSLPVTLENREEYVRLVTNYYLTAQIQPQLNAFLDGFHSFAHRDCIAALNTRALTWLINGEPTLSVDNWEHNTLYEGYLATSMPVIWFWSTVHSFSPEQHAKLLHFVTGSSLVPLGGFSKLDPKFTIARIEQKEDHTPSAATCSRKLNLPNYSSEEILKEKLLYAIEEGQGSFGLV